MKSRIFPVIGLVLAVLIFFVYINPTYTGAVASARAAITQDNQSLAAAAAYTQKENELATAEDAIPTDSLARLNTFLPTSVNNVQLIIDLDALASRSGLSVASINVAGTGSQTSDSGAQSIAAGGQPYGSVDLTFSGSGTYAAFLTFLASVEQSLRLLDVTNLSVTGSATGVYTYSMTLRLYWLQS